MIFSNSFGQCFRLYILVLAMLVLAGCQLSPWRVEQVDLRVEAARKEALSCPADQLDRCSVNSPVMALAARDRRDGKHDLVLLEIGEESLALRLHLIRAAREYIDVQNFILRADDTGNLILDELLNAARRGVKVRLLLDQMFTVADLEHLVSLTMAHANFEIRFYNPSFNKAKMAKHDWVSGVACCFRRFQQRMHNKLMVVDDLVGLLGGRNIADRYFDYDTNYEFKDRDVVVFGPVAVEMRESFDWFWTSQKTVPVQHLRDVAREILQTRPEPLVEFQVPDRLLPLLAKIEDEDFIRTRFVETAFRVEQLQYFSDRPRKEVSPDDTTQRDITAELHDILISAERSVIIQSPYMVLSRAAREVFTELRRRNPEIELVFSTNSLASTDADTVYGNTHKHKDRYVDKLGFAMYEFKPFPADAPDFFPRWPQLMAEKRAGIGNNSIVSGDGSTVNMAGPRVGLHSKSFVVDGRIAMIGSHNFDPRSEGFNTENGLIVWDKAFASELERLIRRDIEPQNSWVVAMLPEDSVPVTNDIPVNYTAQDSTRFFAGPTSLYELAPGKTPLPPGHPDFYLHYYPIGSFPEVVRTERQYLVLFLGLAFGFLEPIL